MCYGQLVSISRLPVFLLSAPLWAQLADVESLVDAFRAKAQAPAVSVALVFKDGTISTLARGWADLENEVAATPSTTFRLGSVSKPFTAVAAIRLAEMGKLDLDLPVENYVRLWKAKEWPVTVRQLLAHLGGVRHYREDLSDFHSTRHYWSLSEALSAFAGDPLVHEPGTKYLYSSYGFNLAGAAVESASGMTYASAVRDLVLNPAGIETMREDDVYRVVPNRARGYRRNRNGTVENCSLADMSVKTPGGGWIATATDVAKFARVLMDGRLLRQDSMDAAFERQQLKGGGRTGYGLGFSLVRDKAPRAIGHSGGQQGATTYLLFCPEWKTAAVVLVNMEALDLRPLAEALLEAASR